MKSLRGMANDPSTVAEIYEKKKSQMSCFVSGSKKKLKRANKLVKNVLKFNFWLILWTYEEIDTTSILTEPTKVYERQPLSMYCFNAGEANQKKMIKKIIRNDVATEISSSSSRT